MRVSRSLDEEVKDARHAYIDALKQEAAGTPAETDSPWKRLFAYVLVTVYPAVPDVHVQFDFSLSITLPAGQARHWDLWVCLWEWGRLRQPSASQRLAATWAPLDSPPRFRPGRGQPHPNRLRCAPGTACRAQGEGCGAAEGGGPEGDHSHALAAGRSSRRAAARDAHAAAFCAGSRQDDAPARIGGTVPAVGT